MQALQALLRTVSETVPLSCDSKLRWSGCRFEGTPANANDH